MTGLSVITVLREVRQNNRGTVAVRVTVAERPHWKVADVGHNDTNHFSVGQHLSARLVQDWMPLVPPPSWGNPHAADDRPLTCGKEAGDGPVCTRAPGHNGAHRWATEEDGHVRRWTGARP